MLEDAKQKISSPRDIRIHMLQKLFEKVEKGVTVHFLDGDP